MLFLILGVFNTSYLLRAIWDQYYSEDDDSFEFAAITTELLLGLVWDFLPVMLMMILHYKNFTIRQTVKEEVPA